MKSIYSSSVVWKSLPGDYWFNIVTSHFEREFNAQQKHQTDSLENILSFMKINGTERAAAARCGIPFQYFDFFFVFVL